MQKDYTHGAYLLVVLLGIPALLMAVAFFAVMGGGGVAYLNDTLVREVTRMVTPGGAHIGAYAAALFFWGVLLVAAGSVWVRAAAPRLSAGEQLFSALALGVFFTVLALAAPSALAALLHFIGDDASAALIETKMVDMLRLNYEQAYEFAWLFGAFLIGIMLWIGREVLRTARRASDASSP